ncbi:MAG: SAM-dependent chlorinase/fluorinase [Deltaproteobacteria bacterium]|nr:SAM-dependent chlorinase/fluorinase [Deltaproteobacteria bacterium]
MGIITLLTDFGLKDPYVGIMKGVILGLNRAVSIVDLTHRIKPGDINGAACVLQESFSFFPPSTIHVAVVDPGVGTDRRPILVKSRNHFFVGPDNGLFWPIIQSDPQVLMVHLTNQNYFLPRISRTFHGRDIFAPVAGHLSLGIDPLAMGERFTNPIRLPHETPTLKGDTLLGRAVRVDYFGNVITNIHREELARFLGNRQMLIRVGKETIEGVVNTYADGPKGKLLALFGSTDHLEIAVNSGRADRLLNIDGTQSLPVVAVDRVAP